jgi:hypothetical protein
MAEHIAMRHHQRISRAAGTVVILLAIIFVLAGVATSCKSPTDSGTPADTTPPTVAIFSTTANPTGTSPIDVSIVFSEVVTGFDEADLTLSPNAAASNFTPSGDSDTFEVELTPSVLGETVTLDIAGGACTDAAGNPNTAATQFSRFYTDRPIPSISSTLSSATNASPIPITIAFSKAVENFDSMDFTLTNCTISAPSPIDGGYVWNAELTPAGEGAVEATVPDGVCDEAGASTVTNVASNTFSITYDITAPDILTLTSSAPDPTNTPYTIDITFSEAIDPATFTGADIAFSVGTGSASDPTTSDYVHWSSTVTPSSQGTVTVTIDAATVKDLAGNDNTAAADSVSRTWDTVQPGVTSITSTGTSATTGRYPIPCTVLFSEAVDPASFAESDITVGGTAAGGQVQAGSLTTSDNTTWTFKLIYTGAGTLTATIDAGKVSDAAGNTNTAPVTPLSLTTITALTFHAAVSARGATSSLSLSMNAGNKNPIALIGVTVENTAAIDITSVTYAGTSATLIGSKIKYDNGADYWIVTALYYVLPPTGNKTVQVTFTGAPLEAKLGCVVLENADQISPILALQTQDIAGPTGTDYVLSTDITSNYYYSMLVDMFGGSDATAATPGAGQTQRWAELTTNTCGASSTEALTTPGATTVGWALSLSQAIRLQHVVVEVKIVQ